MASYLFPLRISRFTNFTTSSTKYLTGLSCNPDDATFSFAHSTIPFELSIWQTDAPADKHATVAAPVYANRFNTFIGLLAFSIFSIIQSQLIACSGKIPVCLNPIGLTLNFKFLYSICHDFGTRLLKLQAPPPVELLSYVASALFHFSGYVFSFHIICGSGLTKIISFHLSSF